MYFYCMFMYSYFSATLNEALLCFLRSCKANAME
jgi:hypothetical protein